MSVDAALVRALALALPETDEAPHRDRAALRVAGKIFATLGGDVMVAKLAPEHAALLLDAEPDRFVSNGWTRRGWLGLRLAAADADLAEHLLRTAWTNVAPKRLRP